MDDALFSSAEGRHRIACELLAPWVAARRWFGGKARKARRWSISRWVSVKPGWLVALDVEYEDRSAESYAVPLRFLSMDATLESGAIVARDGARVLIDATFDPDFRAALFQTMAERRAGVLCGTSGSLLRSMFVDDVRPESRVLAAEQSNTSLIFGGKLFVKLYRRLVAGVNPDEEMTRAISEQTAFRNVPAFCGAIEWAGCALALGVRKVAHECDGWTLALRHFGQSAGTAKPSGRWLAHVGKLGQRTGEMHRALAGLSQFPEFAPEPIERAEIAALIDRIKRSASELAGKIRNRIEQLPSDIRTIAEEVLGRLVSFDLPELSAFQVMKIRIHGDYHLGQVLFTGDDFVIIDFEGEPARSLAERRAKHPPLRDVAGMLRSFSYAGYAAGGGSDPAETQEAFLDGWRSAVAGSAIACDAASERELLRLFLIEKALYETDYELNNRPDWLAIPLRGVLALL